MTLRDYFACQVLAGSHGRALTEASEDSAKKAYEVADAMLAERESRKGKDSN
jgi:hypothetical protein